MVVWRDGVVAEQSYAFTREWGRTADTPCNNCMPLHAATRRYVPLRAVTCRYMPLHAVTRGFDTGGSHAAQILSGRSTVTIAVVPDSYEGMSRCFRKLLSARTIWCAREER